MKIQIDFNKKTIKLEQQANLGEFVDKISKLMDDWKDYALECNTTINWSSYPTYIYPERRWYSQLTHTGTNEYTGSITINKANTSFIIDKNYLKDNIQTVNMEL